MKKTDSVRGNFASGFLDITNEEFAPVNEVMVDLVAKLDKKGVGFVETARSRHYNFLMTRFGAAIEIDYQGNIRVGITEKDGLDDDDIYTLYRPGEPALVFRIVERIKYLEANARELAYRHFADFAETLSSRYGISFRRNGLNLVTNGGLTIKARTRPFNQQEIWISVTQPDGKTFNASVNDASLPARVFKLHAILRGYNPAEIRRMPASDRCGHKPDAYPKVKRYTCGHTEVTMLSGKEEVRPEGNTN